MHTVLKGTTKEVVVGIDRSFVMIGEKINPTGRKKLAAALTEGNLDYVRQLVENQVAWGAQVLDINVGVPGLDEVSIIPKIIELVKSISDIPLCLDSSNPAVLAAGLAVAPGKPLVNSVSGEEKRLETVLPIVKDRGAAVIGLTMDDKGIPATPEERLAVAEKIIECAARIGISIEDIIIDPLVLTVGSDSRAAMITLQTVDLLRKNFGVNINLGASNVSFGLPERPTVNASFLTLAIQMGATCSITDPAKLGLTVRATDLLLGRDDNSMGYLKYFRAAEKLRALEAEKPA
ncbi:MAG: dihydropteroate synthase [Methanoregula sp.]|jgi:5-methyltetrahydrofolate--homocysteine methyltransferase|uniref:dihydropteroate synthase n=1 Tax=Methanoregula sp. TaxID=2052170 RepID=UPI003D12ED0C